MSRKNRGGIILRVLRGDSGAVAVEFAIIAPVFILLFMGMIAYGIFFGAMHSLQQLSADAARASIAGLNLAEREMLARRFIDDNSGAYAFVDRDGLTVSLGESPDGTQFVVNLRYDAENLPIWGLLDALPLPGKIIERSSTIRIGGI